MINIVKYLWIFWNVQFKNILEVTGYCTAGGMKKQVINDLRMRGKYACFWLILIDGKAGLNLSVCILIIQGNYKCYLQK